MTTKSLPIPRWLLRQEVLLGLVVVLFSYFTFFHNYTNPPYLFWDENYHIASAQKYLNGVYFMEPHPPLGKMVIAAGEWLFDVNPEDNQFIGTDYAKELPGDFSFFGYRFFPTLFAWLIAPMFYGIFLLITKRSVWAMFLSFLYVFDNAIITHSRSAMLDSTMLFFVVSMILLFLLLIKYKKSTHLLPLFSLLIGMAFAGLMTTKLLGLIMILLFPVLLLYIYPDFQRIAQFVALCLSGFIVVYVAVWQFHFSSGSRIIDSLPDNGYYQASESHKQLLDSGLTNFPLMLKDHLAFVPHYQKGVPKLNLCKSDENGSPWFFWPLGARSISYRWETPNSEVYQYIYLQSNPVVWLCGLLAVGLAIILLLGSYVVPGAKKLTYRNEIALWLAMWTSFMIAVSQIDRVMYLYHYFIPLIFSFIVVGYVVLELKQLGVFKLTDARKEWLLLGFGTLMFLSFHFYRPFTYYEPISDEAFQRRNILSIWGLKCVNCERTGQIASPIECS